MQLSAGAVLLSMQAFVSSWDPWERLRKLRAGFKNTKLQMLFRGQNILGYRPYADDVVEYFVQKSLANDIDIIRIFDCMNDLATFRLLYMLQTKSMAMHRLLFPIHLVMLILLSTGQRCKTYRGNGCRLLSVSKIWPVLLLPYSN